MELFGLVDKFKNKKNSSESPESNLSQECQRGCCIQTDGNNKAGILSTYFDQNHLNHFSLKETLTDQEIKIIGKRSIGFYILNILKHLAIKNGLWLILLVFGSRKKRKKKK